VISGVWYVRLFVRLCPYPNMLNNLSTRFYVQETLTLTLTWPHRVFHLPRCLRPTVLALEFRMDTRSISHPWHHKHTTSKYHRRPQWDDLLSILREAVKEAALPQMDKCYRVSRVTCTRKFALVISKSAGHSRKAIAPMWSTNPCSYSSSDTVRSPLSTPDLR
jgi:hypothetical protein